METILDDIVENGVTSKTLSLYLAKLDTTLADAYTAAENGQELTSMAKVGEAKMLNETIQALWKKLTNK